MTRLCFFDAKVRFWVIVLELVGRKLGLYPSKFLVCRKDVRGWKEGIRMAGLDGWLGRVIILLVVDMFLFKGWKNVEVVNFALMAATESEADGVKDEAIIDEFEVVVVSIALFPLLWLSLVVLSVVLELLFLARCDDAAVLDDEIVQRRAKAAVRILIFIVIRMLDVCGNEKNEVTKKYGWWMEVRSETKASRQAGTGMMYDLV